MTLCLSDFDNLLQLFWWPQNSWYQIQTHKNPSNIRNVMVIFLLFQVNCEFLNFHDHFYLAQFAFSRETILNMFTRDGHNQFIFMKCFRYQVLPPVPNLPTNLIMQCEYWPSNQGTISDRQFQTSLFPNPQIFFLPIQRELHCNN